MLNIWCFSITDTVLNRLLLTLNQTNKADYRVLVDTSLEARSQQALTEVQGAPPTP